MGPVLDVVVDKAQLASVDSALNRIKNGSTRVIVRALNKVGKGGQTQVVRFLAGRSGMKQKDIRGRYVKYKSANFKNFTARIMLRGNATPVSKLKPKQDARGVTFTNPITGQREMIEKAFIYTMKSGYRGVFRRAKLGVDSWFMAKWGRRMGRVLSGRVRAFSKVTPEGFVHRLPIETQYGPSMVDAFLPEIPSFTANTADKLRREIEVQTKLVLERAKK